MKVDRVRKADDNRKNKDTNLIADMDRNAKRAPWLVHAAGAQEVTELAQNLNQLQGLELHAAVARAVALYYDEDPTTAGMVTAALSCFPGEQAIYYASIVRYTDPGGGGKQVIGACKAPGLEAAIRGAARAWLDELQAARRQRIKERSEQETDDAQEQLDMGNLLTKSLEEAKASFSRFGDTMQVFAPDPGPVFGGTPIEALAKQLHDLGAGQEQGEEPAEEHDLSDPADLCVRRRSERVDQETDEADQCGESEDNHASELRTDT